MTGSIDVEFDTMIGSVEFVLDTMTGSIDVEFDSMIGSVELLKLFLESSIIPSNENSSAYAIPQYEEETDIGVITADETRITINVKVKNCFI